MKFYIYVLLLIGSVFSTSLMGQSTQGFHFQAVVRDDAGNPMPNKKITLGFEITLQGPGIGPRYVETHTTETNSLGLVQAIIGKGESNGNSFDVIDWGKGNYYLMVEIDGEAVDTTLFEGVPFAKVATDMELQDLQNVNFDAPRVGDVLQWDGGDWVSVAGEELEKGDADRTNEIQTLLFNQSNNSLRLSKVDGTISMDKFVSPWQEADTSGRIYFPDRIGLGLSNPTAQLHIKDQAFLMDDVTPRAYGQLKLSGTDNQGRTLTIFDGSPDGNYWSMYTESASPSATFRISHNELGNTFTINNQGNVGIGSGNAEAKLQIRGPLTDEGQLKITSSGDNGTRISLGNSVDRNFWYIDGSISDPFIEIGHKRNQNNPILAMAPFSDNQLGGILSARGQMIITSQNKLSGLSITEILSGELPFSGAYYGTYSNISGNGFTSSGAIDMVGLFSRASGSQGKARLVVGVEATAIEGQNGTYGVLAKAEAEKFDYAVYADGNVFSTGSYLPSDRKLKSNIQPLQKGLSTIMALRPTSFRYDKNNSQHMDLPGGEQYGLIAQEVEVLLPGLTKKSYHAYAMRDSTALHGGFAFTAVNYVGLIPFLISATQEQQQIINRQNQLLTTQAGQIQELMGKFRQLEARLEAVSYSLSSSYQSN